MSYTGFSNSVKNLYNTTTSTIGSKFRRPVNNNDIENPLIQNDVNSPDPIMSSSEPSTSYTPKTSILFETTSQLKIIDVDILQLESEIDDLDKLIQERTNNLPNKNINRLMNDIDIIIDKITYNINKLPGITSSKKVKFVTLSNNYHKIKKIYLDITANSNSSTHENKIDSTQYYDNNHNQLYQQVIDPINDDQYDQQRTDHIVQISKDIHGVHQIFTQINTLVADQGLLVDNIDENISTTLVNTTQGKKELNKANKHSKSSTKCKICTIIMLCMALIALIVVFLREKNQI